MYCKLDLKANEKEILLPVVALLPKNTKLYFNESTKKIKIFDIKKNKFKEIHIIEGILDSDKIFEYS